VLAVSAACTAAWAQVDLPLPAAQQPGVLDMSGLPPRVDRPARLEVVTATLPRFDPLESSSSSERIGMTLLPPRPSAIGLSVDMSGFAQPAAPQGAGLAPTAQPAVDVGLHWRQSLDRSMRLDVTAWRRMTPQQPDAWSLVQLRQQPTYGARVEVNLSARNAKGFVADKGFIGVQLDNSRSITVRRKDGHPMLYYRVKF
jgi:hypothetical protein